MNQGYCKIDCLALGRKIAHVMCKDLKKIRMSHLIRGSIIFTVLIRFCFSKKCDIELFCVYIFVRDVREIV